MMHWNDVSREIRNKFHIINWNDNGVISIFSICNNHGISIPKLVFNQYQSLNIRIDLSIGICQFIETKLVISLTESTSNRIIRTYKECGVSSITTINTKTKNFLRLLNYKNKLKEYESYIYLSKFFISLVINADYDEIKHKI